MQKKWEKTENSLPPLGNHEKKQSLSKHIKIMTFWILITSACKFKQVQLLKCLKNFKISVEHVLSIAVAIYDATDCPAIPDVFHAYFMMSFRHPFNLLPYNSVLAVIFQLIDTITTFIWTYNDLFVIVISMGLTFRFKQINEQLLEMKGKVSKFLGWFPVEIVNFS